jgi:hypothetical protein
MTITLREIRDRFEHDRYFDFGSQRYEVIEGASGVLRVDKPTYIKQADRDLYVVANSPVLIEGGRGELGVNAHGPVMIRDTQGGLAAFLRDTSIIASAGGDVQIIALPHLEFIATALGGAYNGIRGCSFAKEDAPNGNWKTVALLGCKGNLNFSHYMPDTSQVRKAS